MVLLWIKKFQQPAEEADTELNQLGFLIDPNLDQLIKSKRLVWPNSTLFKSSVFRNIFGHFRQK